MPTSATHADSGYAASAIRFDNRFVRELPGDPIAENYRRQVKAACYSRVMPLAVSQPKLVAYSREVAAELGFDEAFCQSEAFAQVFAGNRLLPGMEPFAMCYGGHQFGNWAGQLGDGRAINLGEILTPEDNHQTLQLKGAGPTPYSRSADGLAILRSSIREFLCSEAMHHLGVPTTRALSLLTTGEQVVRDMFYDGNPQHEPGAVVCRVAPSFVRFGNFEILTARGDHDLLKQLVDYTIRQDFPHLHPAQGNPGVDTYLQWLREVCRRTAEMIVHWMRVGFVHGVMNTDNMSILGLTIDYGPYGWLDNYDPDWTPNTTDAGGKRYRFGYQAQIAQWNLYQLGNALYPLIDAVEPLQEVLGEFPGYYTQLWQQMMADKLGLQEADIPLIRDLLSTLQAVETDMTIFFRRLATLELSTDFESQQDEALARHFADAYYRPEQLDSEYHARLADWLRRYQARVVRDGTADPHRRHAMNRVNPHFVLRNYLAQQAIDKAEAGDCREVSRLLEALRRPYDEHPDYTSYAEKRPDWARSRPGCSMLSCSS